MAKIHKLRLLFSGIEHPLIAVVLEEECERLQSRLADLLFSETSVEFFNFSTLDGKFYSINLKQLQSVNYLWEATSLAPDRTRYDGSIEVYLLNRHAPVQTYTEAPVEVYDFFCNLESDNGSSFLGFTDNDSELLTFQCNEIVYAITPEHIYDEGQEIVDKEDLS